MKTLTVVKIGGRLLEGEADSRTVLQLFAQIPAPKILIHGGGKKATELSIQLGLTPNIKNGRRITDQATLDITTMVYAGLINKKIVSRLQQLKCNALGLSGADGNLILSNKRPIQEIDYGYVGDIQQVNVPLLVELLKLNITPVFCAITHDEHGQLLNTNADTIAATVASSLSDYYTVQLKICLDKNGVLLYPDDDNSTIDILTHEAYLSALENDSISGGMIPKLENAFKAKNSNVHQVMLCGIDGLKEEKGTTICL